MGALGRARAAGAADVAQRQPLAQQVSDPRRHEEPRSHVAGLFLKPDDLFQARVALYDAGDLRRRERVQLLHAHAGDSLTTGLLASRIEIVIDLAAAEEQAA